MLKGRGAPFRPKQVRSSGEQEVQEEEDPFGSNSQNSKMHGDINDSQKALVKHNKNMSDSEGGMFDDC
jgi:hypothetical protein